MAEAQKIGLIGLGTMGSALALNLAEKGAHVVVQNRTQAVFPNSSPRLVRWLRTSKVQAIWPIWSHACPSRGSSS